MKYVIEIEDKPLFYYDEDTATYFPRVHKAIGFNTLVFDEEGLKRLTPIGMVTDAAYDDGYTKGYEQARFGWNLPDQFMALPDMGEEVEIKF